MKVRLDNGRVDVDLDVENGYEPFLYVVFKALAVLNYSTEDIKTKLEEYEDE